MIRTAAILTLCASLSAALAVVTDGPFWGWATLITMTALAASIASAAAGKGRP